MSLKSIHEYDSDQLRNEIVFLKNELENARSNLKMWILFAFAAWNCFVSILAWKSFGDTQLVPLVATFINIAIWYKVTNSMESADFERRCRHIEKNEA